MHSDSTGHKTYIFKPYTVKGASTGEMYGTWEDTARDKGGEPADCRKLEATEPYTVKDISTDKGGEPADGDNRSNEDQNHDAGQGPDKESSEDGEMERDATIEEDLAILLTSDEGYNSSRPETPPASEPYTDPSSLAISETASLPGDANTSTGAGFPPHLPRPDIPEQAIINIDRSRTRIIMCPVGEPIVTFKSTRELVRAIRDAIKGAFLQHYLFFFSLLANERT